MKKNTTIQSKTKAKTTTTNTKKATKAPAKTQQPKKEEVKKQQEIPKKVEPQPIQVYSATAQNFLQKWEDLEKENGKSLILIDTTDIVFTFLKFKGSIIDVAEHAIQNAIDKKPVEFFQEKVRAQMVACIKIGYPTVINFDKLLETETTKLKNLFKDAKFYQEKMLFDPKVIKSREYYGNYLLKEEEDVDNFGNKGWYKHADSFMLALLMSGVEEDYHRMIKHHELDPDQFQVLVIR